MALGQSMTAYGGGTAPDSHRLPFVRLTTHPTSLHIRAVAATYIFGAYSAMLLRVAVHWCPDVASTP